MDAELEQLLLAFEFLLDTSHIEQRHDVVAVFDCVGIDETFKCSEIRDVPGHVSS